MIVRKNAFWSDTFSHPSGLAFAYCLGSDIGHATTVIVEVGDTEVLHTVAPSTPRYLRGAAAPDGSICLVGQAQDGSGLLIYRNGEWFVPKFADGRPCPCYAVPAVRWDPPPDSLGFMAYTQISALAYVRVYDTGLIVQSPIPIGLTSAGIAQVLDDGTVMWAQDARQRTIRGTTLLVTMEVQGIVTGQYGGVVGGIPVDVGEPFLALDAPGMDPRLAYSPVTDRYGVASWTQQNTACFQELPPFPPLPDPPIDYPTVAPFTHRVRISPFKDLDGTSGADSEIVIDGASQAIPRPCWVGFDRDGGTTAIDRACQTGTLLGIAAEGFGTRGYDHGRAYADKLQTRLAWWSDGPQMVSPPSGLNPWDQVWQECYVFKEFGETLAQAVQRWKWVLQMSLNSPCQVVGIIPQYFTRGLFTEQETVNIIAAGLELVNGSSRIQEIAPFEYSRANGITGVPALREMFNRCLAASVQGIPAFPAPFPPQPGIPGLPFARVIR